MDAALETLLLAFSSENAPRIPDRCLVLGARPHPDFRLWPRLVGWQPFKPLADDWESRGFDRVDEIPEHRWPMVLVLPGKSRDETLHWFAMARDHLEPGGVLLCSMPNTAGAARFEKELRSVSSRIHSVQKNRCRAFWAFDDGAWNEQVIAEWRSIGIPRRIEETPYITVPGVFSSGHVDPGSAFLVAHLPSHLFGRVADLGAGWGYLADSALNQCPKIARVDLYEADARALRCARVNLAGQERELGFHWHDVTRGIPDMYDAILMNPPFHTGQGTDIDLGRAFLAAASGSLRRGGALYLVANRQLPYEGHLDRLHLTWRIAAENTTYKLLFATKR